jgi:hypothetical protein
MSDQAPEPEEPAEEAQPIHVVIVRRDLYGRPVEWVEATDPAAAEHWDERHWRRWS